MEQNWHWQPQALLQGLLGGNHTNLALDLILEVVDFSFKLCDGCHYPLNMVGRQGARGRDGGSMIGRWERAQRSGCLGHGMWVDIYGPFECSGEELGRCRGAGVCDGDRGIFTNT